MGAAGGVLGFVLGKSKPATSFGAKVGTAQKKVTCLSPAEAKQYISAKSPIIIDVRDSGDLRDGIRGAVSIPLSNIAFAADQDFAIPEDLTVQGRVKVPKGTKFIHKALQGNKGKPILVSCGLGGQAAMAAEILVDYGYSEVRAVAGGNSAWMDFGGEVCACAK